MTEHLLLVDCSAFAYRAYYTQPAMRRESDGEPTGAVLGFMAMIWRMIGAAQADPPTMAAAVFDAPGKNFRHALFPAYKGNRDPARSLELENQLPTMRPVAEVLGLTPIELEGYEADDLIATLANSARAAGIRCTIVSSDKDFGQLVEDGWIEIVDPMQKSRDPTKSSRRLVADIVKKFGVPPAQVPDVQALAGDTADGIPGIPGIGLERAGALVRRFGSLEGVLANPRQVRWLTVRASLEKHADKARLYLQLTTLKRDVPLKISWGLLKVQPIMKSHLIQVVRAINPSARVEALFGLDLQDVRVVERVADPYEWWREEVMASGQRLPDMPACGYYKTKLVKDGAWVPARIWREPQLDPVMGTDTGFDLLRCEINGRPKDAMAVFPRLSMYPIKAEDFEFEKADAAHAKAYRPGDPKADPTKPINLSEQPAPRNPRRKTA